MYVTVRTNENSTASLTYKLQDSLFDINATSPVYFLQEVEDERYEIFFGDGVFGKKLDNNNFITVRYILTNGESANGISSFTFTGRMIYTRNALEYTVTDAISLLTSEM